MNRPDTANRRAHAARIAAGVILVALTGASTASSHTGGSTGYASITIAGDGIRYTLTLWPSTLPSVIAEDLRGARAGDATRRSRLLDVIRDKITLTVGGRRCEAGSGSVVLAAAPADSVTLVVDFTCAEPVHDLAIRDDLFDAFGADYHTLARIAAREQTQQFAFTPEGREARFHIDDPGRGRGVASFTVLGIEHILSGYDHVLFLVGLLLPGGSLLTLAKVISAFTVAHSITLSLAVLDVVHLPDRLIEATIALSIAAVAAENVVRRSTVTHRWVVSLAFGLVHGLGFSSALREMGLPSQGLVLSLFGFNAGVELGQALIVALWLPVMAAVRTMGWERRLVRGASIAILLVGLALFVERAFL